MVNTSSYIKRIAHITIGVSDLTKSVSFFQSILGLRKMGEWPTYAIFDIVGVSFGLEPKSKTEICLLVDDVDKAYQNLRDKGVKFVTEPKDQPWGVRDAKLIDPDGNTFVIESLKCNVCGKTCQSYPELLEEHLRKHK
ncbi:MAG: VOC family protein [Candidatus Bathyarchaeota archaeon]|nr:VOC family protein [Candidatus Bathyarchaeota archaeon]MDH5732178.1 VOC family protein [Candidatus Bathyarchaeota archaeon]